MLSELIRTIYDTAAMDWATAEKVTYAMLTYMERKLPPEEFAKVKGYMFGYMEYTLPDRSGYPGYKGSLPDQARLEEE